MIKDFSELYIGKNPGQLVKEYEKKKKKEMLFLLIAALAVIGLCIRNDWQNSRLDESYRLLREGTDGGKKEVSLQMKTEEEVWEDISLELYPKEYSKEELQLLFIEACKEIPQAIQNENESLENVSSDLNLIPEIEGYPFLLTWDSSDTEVIDYEGHLMDYQEDLDRIVELTAVLEYGEWEKEYKLSVHVIKKVERNFISSLKDTLKQQEKQTREQKEFYLPKKFWEKEVQWRYPPGNSSIVLGALFSMILPLIFFQKDKEIHEQARKRKEQMQEDFPEFISKLILLMEAGMNIRGAFFQIAEDGQKVQSKNTNYLQEELNYVCRQMKNGLSEKDAYELLGKRCNLACYKKLSGLLIQHLQKGGSRILETLRAESQKASEEQKRQIQKKGEEMGTKLLFPMIIMLGIVMIFIMVPALFSFQM